MGWLLGWSCKYELSAQAAKIPGNLTSVTGTLDLSRMPASFWENISFTDGRDIRITQADGTTEEARHVVDIDTVGETGQVNFMMSSLSGGGSTFYLYICNGSATEPAPGDSNGQYNAYRAAIVAQFNCEASATLTDSTSNGNDGADIGSSKTLETGLFSTNSVGYSTGAFETYRLPDFAVESAVSVFMMIKSTDTTGRLITAKWDGAVDNVIHFWQDGSGKLANIISSVSDGSTSDTVTSTTSLTADVWEAVGFSFSQSSTDHKLFLNGVLEDSSTFGNNLYDSAKGIDIGNQRGGSGATNFQGVTDAIYFFNEYCPDDEQTVLANMHLDQTTFWTITEVLPIFNQPSFLWFN